MTQSLTRLIPSRLLVRETPSPGRPSLLLTFDDGPHPDITPEVLSRLAKYQARAVFFVIGERVDAHPGLAKEIARSGHLLGNHTQTHPRHEPGSLAYLREIRQCQGSLVRHVGRPARLFRPPRGRISLKSLLLPASLGLRMLHWSLNVRDWACETRDHARVAGEHLVQGAQPGRIAVLHDDEPLLLPILDFALPRLADAGFDLSGGITNV